MAFGIGPIMIFYVVAKMLDNQSWCHIVLLHELFNDNVYVMSITVLFGNIHTILAHDALSKLVFYMVRVHAKLKTDDLIKLHKNIIT